VLALQGESGYNYGRLGTIRSGYALRGLVLFKDNRLDRYLPRGIRYEIGLIRRPLYSGLFLPPPPGSRKSMKNY